VGLIVPYFAQAQTGTVVIDGVTYRVPLIDSGGRVYVNAKATGAGEVLAARRGTVAPSTTRVTLATPSSGLQIRIISFMAMNGGSTGARFELYFGAGATITTTAGKEIANIQLDADTQASFGLAWPDGGGPVGAADDVVSVRTNVDIGTDGVALIHYREE
jgi:hypothetical protein